MRKFNLVIALTASIVLLPGCKLQEFGAIVDPNPLEVHGGDVPFKISAKLDPPKRLNPNTKFMVKTIYVYGDQEQEVGEIQFLGSEYDTSTSPNEVKNFTFPYQDGMNRGILYVKGVAIKKSGKTKSSDTIRVAQGLVLTSMWVQDVAMTSYADHGYNDKEELIATNVDFYFDKGRSNLRTSLSYDGTTNSSRRKELDAFIAAKNVTRTVTITGTHSPEGTETINSNLSNDRASTIEKFYRGRMDRYDYEGTADLINFMLKPVVQDWSAFKAALASYEGISEEEKSEYTRIINGTGSFADMEKEMKKLPTYKKVFNEVYPSLRTAQTEVLTVKPKKTNPEISILAKAITNGEAEADTLTTEELMFSATLTPSLEEKAAIYKAAADATGKWEAHNNLAAVHLEMAMKGDDSKLDGAATQLEIAMNKNDDAIVQANMVALRVLQGNYEEAYALVKGVNGSNDVAAKTAAMQGALEVRMGEYEQAKASFASAAESESVNVDKGLAYLLNREYIEADREFAKTETKESYYLRAVSAARQSMKDEVRENLTKAVDAEPALKEKIINDLEFANFPDEVKTALNN